LLKENVQEVVTFRQDSGLEPSPPWLKGLTSRVRLAKGAGQPHAANMTWIAWENMKKDKFGSLASPSDFSAFSFLGDFGLVRDSSDKIIILKHVESVQLLSIVEAEKGRRFAPGPAGEPPLAPPLGAPPKEKAEISPDGVDDAGLASEIFRVRRDVAGHRYQTSVEVIAAMTTEAFHD
jgi:hypothetical protein